MTPATSTSTIVRSAPGASGWRALTRGPGEPYRGTIPDGEPLAAFWHLSDLHICDAESPGRQEYLDRFSDPDSPYRQALGDVGTYRPQEILTVQVAVSMVMRVNQVSSGPTTGRPIDGVIITGDVVDNAQRNELDWYRLVLEGGVVLPRSGDEAASSWVGASGDVPWDVRYWHPDGPVAGVEADLPTRVFGYPSIPGLVEAARRAVVSPGLRLPWFTVHGNHDALLQGTVLADEALRALVRGGERITGLPDGLSPMATSEAIPGTGPARYLHDASSPRTPITADARRDFLRPGEFARDVLPHAGPPGRGYYVADIGAVRMIALDTVNPHGGWQGSIDHEQFAWLRDRLEEAVDRYVVISSHHPSPTMTNDWAPPGAPPRILGEAVVDLLLDHPQVIAWVAGHVHHHAAGFHSRADRRFLELTTSSLIDWPQQGRVLEFVRSQVGGEPMIAVVSTVYDHMAPIEWSMQDLGDVRNLAAISRTLAANDYQLREESPRGLRLDSSPDVRNAVWFVPDPHA